ncbi:MAG: transglycosylase SLT domain-containing protein [Thiohalocapsa sp.]
MAQRSGFQPPPHRRHAELVLTLALVLALPTAAGMPSAERSAFIAAEQALAASDRETFDEFAARLADYPLHPYLHLADLMRRLDSVSADEVQVFLARYRGTAPAERLRLRWLKHLASQGHWREYVDAYVDNGSETRECLYRRGLLVNAQDESAFDGLDALYLVGSSLPDACDALFSAWSKSGQLIPAFVWQRVDLALQRGNTGVARFQRRYLPAEQRVWLDQLLQIHARPELLASERLPSDPQRRIAAITHGIERLARRNPLVAAEVWRKLQDEQRLPEPALERINLAIGVAMARERDNTGLYFLHRIEPHEDNIDIQRERLRAALRLRAWSDLATWVQALPPAADEDGEWQYWLGRSLGQNGDLAGAAHAFSRAAVARSFWGFRAADLLGKQAALAHRPAPVDTEQFDALLTSETVARIRELRALGRGLDVSREWRELTGAMEPDELVTAAAVAQHLGLVTESIFTLARGDYWDDLDIRFPMANLRLIRAAAEAQGLPADWVYAIVRQESAFDTDIASHAGAIGLMQLMPATAAEMARDAGMDRPSKQALIDPRLNVDLGSRYLARMRRRFGGDSVVATAAYNAGPAAVRRWLPTEPLAADLWMSEIPYRETRDYVRRVLTYRVIYAHKLGHEHFRLGSVLRPVSTITDTGSSSSSH